MAYFEFKFMLEEDSQPVAAIRLLSTIYFAFVRVVSKEMFANYY
jgi:hypothetical protein